MKTDMTESRGTIMKFQGEFLVTNRYSFIKKIFVKKMSRLYRAQTERCSDVLKKEN